MTKQEMFNRAYSGLKAQGFQQSITVDKDNHGDSHTTCVYLAADGKRCAWGHVDTSLTDQPASVRKLKEHEIGIAANLSDEDLDFAYELQGSHDLGKTPAKMEQYLVDLAERYHLQVP